MENFASKELQNSKLSTKIEQGSSEGTDGVCEQQEIYIGPHDLMFFRNPIKNSPLSRTRRR
jgi:hypothetical protein